MSYALKSEFLRFSVFRTSLYCSDTDAVHFIMYMSQNSESRWNSLGPGQASAAKDMSLWGLLYRA